MDLKQALTEELSDEELEKLTTSFEVVGDIAMIEIHEDLYDKKNLIGKKLMEINKHISTVLMETSERKGEFRKREYEVIAGDEDTETIHKEHGCRFKLDPTMLYFSEREATERQRIVEKVNEGDRVLDMFAGVGPFSIIIANKVEDVEVLAIELNPDAYNYLDQNVELNKLDDDIITIQGDAKQICPNFKDEFDRVIMHLPKTTGQFLDAATESLKPGGIIHYYSWGEEENLYQVAEQELNSIANKKDLDYEIIDKRKVLPYAPGKWKICLDVKFF